MDSITSDQANHNKITTVSQKSRPYALITGASSGIGYELAHLFAKDGHSLILVARSEPELTALSKALCEHYQVQAIPIVCDLSAPQASKQLFLQIQDYPLRFLVNNAGIGHFGEFAQIDLESTQQLLQLNIMALTELTKLCLPSLLQQPNARILQLGSTAAFQPGPYLATYYASKAYVLSFSQALAYELRNTSVKVTCFCPGPTTTLFHHRAKLENSRLFQKNLMTADAVAKIGYHAMLSGKRMIIPGWKNKLLISLSNLAPQCLTTWIAGYLNQQRRT